MLVNTFSLFQFLALLLPTLADEGADLFRASSAESPSNHFFKPSNAYLSGPEQQQYGAMHSPNLNLIARQRNQCSLLVKCSENTCCPAGNTCVCLLELESLYSCPASSPSSVTHLLQLSLQPSDISFGASVSSVLTFYV